MTAVAKKTTKKTAKKTAKKPAKKTAKKPAPRLMFSVDATIRIGKALAEANPRREGSAAHGRLEMLRKYDGKTVGAYLAKGGVNQTLINAVKGYGATVVGG